MAQCNNCVHKYACYMKEVCDDIEQQIQEFGCEDYLSADNLYRKEDVLKYAELLEISPYFQEQLANGDLKICDYLKSRCHTIDDEMNLRI